MGAAVNETVVDAVRKDGLVNVPCTPPNGTETLDWEGIDVNDQKITPISSTISSDGDRVLSFPADARFNRSIFTCYSYQYQASSTQILSVVIVNVLFQGICS